MWRFPGSRNFKLATMKLQLRLKGDCNLRWKLLQVSEPCNCWAYIFGVRGFQELDFKKALLETTPLRRFDPISHLQDWWFRKLRLPTFIAKNTTLFRPTTALNTHWQLSLLLSQQGSNLRRLPARWRSSWLLGIEPQLWRTSKCTRAHRSSCLY